VAKLLRLSARLWREYARRQKAEDRLRRQRRQLILDNLPQAAAIARNVWRRFTRTGQGGYSLQIDYEDMVSLANIGLVEAAGRWDPSKGSFQKFCFLRVRGAVLDAHRRGHYIDLKHESIDGWTHENAGDDTDAKRVGLYLTDPRRRPDELADRSQRRAVLQAVAARVLDEDEQRVLRWALHGAAVTEIARECGQTPAWTRQKLAEAKKKASAEVQRRIAA
jgi:RNA polymerase sigma factor (sigma-70 family)